jgi:hypothetical protein
MEEDWVIDRVLKRRMRSGQSTVSVLEKEYLIRWEAYTEDSDSWHTVDELETMYGEMVSSLPSHSFSRKH